MPWAWLTCNSFMATQPSAMSYLFIVKENKGSTVPRKPFGHHRAPAVTARKQGNLHQPEYVKYTYAQSLICAMQRTHTLIFHKCIRIYNVAWNSLWQLYAYMKQASNANFDNQMSATRIGYWESLWHREEAAPYMMHSLGLNSHEADMANRLLIASTQYHIHN